MTQSQEDTPYAHEMELVDSSKSSIRIKKIATAGILAALSLASFSPLAAFIPRIPGWGIALIDPISFCWIVAFLLGGIEVGLLTTFAGSIGLFFFDPFTPIGPIFKILATIPMILIPWVGMRLRAPDGGGEYLGNMQEYALLMVLAYVVRLGIMIPLNLLVAPIFFPEFDTFSVIIYALTLNTVQSILDAIGPFIIVHLSSLFKHFGMW
ncbi:MAG: hypothetical protein PVG65_06585 [Candidatus Thorarchaeota archaeon]